MIHAYVNNGQPQLRLGFPNGYTASVIVLGDGGVALAYWPTFNDDVDPKKFTEEEREARANAVVLGNQSADAVEVTLFLQTVEALPPPEKEDE